MVGVGVFLSSGSFFFIVATAITSLDLWLLVVILFVISYSGFDLGRVFWGSTTAGGSGAIVGALPRAHSLYHWSLAALVKSKNKTVPTIATHICAQA